MTEEERKIAEVKAEDKAIVYTLLGVLLFVVFVVVCWVHDYEYNTQKEVQRLKEQKEKTLIWQNETFAAWEKISGNPQKITQKQFWLLKDINQLSPLNQK